MDAFEQARSDDLYARHLRALKLQGKAPATIEGYARALRHAAAHFDRCPDQLSVEDFQSYFAGLIDYDTAQRNVTFRYRDAQSQTIAYRTLPLVDFLSCVLQHVLPGGLCRVRHYGLCTAKPSCDSSRCKWFCASSSPSNPPFPDPHCAAPAAAAPCPSLPSAYLGNPSLTTKVRPADRHDPPKHR